MEPWTKTLEGTLIKTLRISGGNECYSAQRFSSLLLDYIQVRPF